MNGWSNRETWLHGLHNGDWAFQNADGIERFVENGWQANPANLEEFWAELKPVVESAICVLLNDEIDTLATEVQDAIDGLHNMFINDIIDCWFPFKQINVVELAAGYANDYIDLLKEGTVSLSILEEIKDAVAVS